jgi:hypothetical protein
MPNNGAEKITTAPAARWQHFPKPPHLYGLVEKGLVKSVSLRRRGNVKGVRLFYFPGISEYLQKLMEGRMGEGMMN